MEATANNYFTYKYPTGFALSGGFIKGFAHLGVMQALLEHGIRPDVLSGVSAGALASFMPTETSRTTCFASSPATRSRI